MRHELAAVLAAVLAAAMPPTSGHASSEAAINLSAAFFAPAFDAIVADIDSRRHPLHVAIENFGHDANIGTVVRTVGDGMWLGEYFNGDERTDDRQLSAECERCADFSGLSRIGSTIGHEDS